MREAFAMDPEGRPGQVFRKGGPGRRQGGLKLAFWRILVLTVVRSGIDALREFVGDLVH